MKQKLHWTPIKWDDAIKIIGNSDVIRIPGGVVIDYAIDKLDSGEGVYEAIRFGHDGRLWTAEGTLLDFQDCE